LPEKQAV